MKNCLTTKLEERYPSQVLHCPTHVKQQCPLQVTVEVHVSKADPFTLSTSLVLSPWPPPPTRAMV